MDTYYAKIMRDMLERKALRRKLILILRKGGMTYADIGKRLHISHQRVHQIAKGK